MFDGKVKMYLKHAAEYKSVCVLVRGGFWNVKFTEGEMII